MTQLFKKTFTVGVILGIISLLPGCGNEESSSSVVKKEETGVSTKAVKTAPLVVVNVLDKEVYDDCHIKGSINVPYDELKEYAQKNWDRNTTKVVVYCSTFRCAASIEAAQMLIKEVGFNKENVWAYEGGAALAHHDGLPMEGPCKEAYLKDIPQEENKATEQEGVQLISSKNLKEMLQKFA